MSVAQNSLDSLVMKEPLAPEVLPSLVDDFLECGERDRDVVLIRFSLF